MAEIYLMMNKPAGYVCSAASDSHKTVYELLPAELQKLVKDAKRGHRLHTIGRLDADTKGLLLLTTDGKFSHNIAAAPSTSSGITIAGSMTRGIAKTYLATLKDPVGLEVQKEYIAKAAAGLVLPPEKKAAEQEAAPAEVFFINETSCQIKVWEGKFHEVRRIFRALGNEVIALQRIAIGQLFLPASLKPGDYISFSPEQIYGY